MDLSENENSNDLIKFYGPIGIKAILAAYLLRSKPPLRVRESAEGAPTEPGPTPE